MNIDESWLLQNGVDQETLDKALGRRSTTATAAPGIPAVSFQIEYPEITFEPVVARDVRIWIPILGWCPATVNEMARSVKAKIRLKKRDRAVVCEAVRVAGLPRATGKRQLSIEIRVPKAQRRYDPDATWKSTQDACVHAGLLVNDNPVWYRLGKATYAPERGPLRTTLVLEELDGQ